LNRNNKIDLEWKVLYVGSARDSHKDQILDEILVGPVPVGMNKFVLQADAPDFNQLPPDDVLGVTVVLVTCSYREREFVRVGYYVNNEYSGEYDPDIGIPPINSPNFDMKHVQRQILADKPRVTKFPISWNSTTTTNNNNNSSNNNDQANNGQETNDDTTSDNNDMSLIMNESEQREIELEVISRGYNNPDAIKGYSNDDEDVEDENNNNDVEDENNNNDVDDEEEDIDEDIEEDVEIDLDDDDDDDDEEDDDNDAIEEDDDNHQNTIHHKSADCHDDNITGTPSTTGMSDMEVE
jgi:histone chaperone ASF1